MKQVIGRGAEALIYLEDDIVVKERLQKRYRHPQLDLELRKTRTRKEGNILLKLPGIVPVVHDVNDVTMQIRMEHLQGQLLRDILNHAEEKKQRAFLHRIGELTGIIHQRNIIHGDLTTSNIISTDKDLVFIDFGLGYISAKDEDKAVDLHVFRQSLQSKHASYASTFYTWFLEGYQKTGSASVLRRLDKVEHRGRYKRKQQRKV